MCNNYGQTFFQAHYYKKLYHKMQSAAIIIQKVRFNYNAIFTIFTIPVTFTIFAIFMSFVMSLSA